MTFVTCGGSADAQTATVCQPLAWSHPMAKLARTDQQEQENSHRGRRTKKLKGPHTSVEGPSRHLARWSSRGSDPRNRRRSDLGAFKPEFGMLFTCIHERKAVFFQSVHLSITAVPIRRPLVWRARTVSAGAAACSCTWTFCLYEQLIYFISYVYLFCCCFCSTLYFVGGEGGGREKEGRRG